MKSKQETRTCKVIQISLSSSPPEVDCKLGWSQSILCTKSSKTGIGTQWRSDGTMVIWPFLGCCQRAMCADLFGCYCVIISIWVKSTIIFSWRLFIEIDFCHFQNEKFLTGYNIRLWRYFHIYFRSLLTHSFHYLGGLTFLHCIAVIHVTLDIVDNVFINNFNSTLPTTCFIFAQSDV